MRFGTAYGSSAHIHHHKASSVSYSAEHFPLLETTKQIECVGTRSNVLPQVRPTVVLGVGLLPIGVVALVRAVEHHRDVERRDHLPGQAQTKGAQAGQYKVVARSSAVGNSYAPTFVVPRYVTLIFQPLANGISRSSPVVRTRS